MQDACQSWAKLPRLNFLRSERLPPGGNVLPQYPTVLSADTSQTLIKPIESKLAWQLHNE